MDGFGIDVEHFNCRNYDGFIGGELEVSLKRASKCDLMGSFGLFVT